MTNIIALIIAINKLRFFISKNVKLYKSISIYGLQIMIKKDASWRMMQQCLCTTRSKTCQLCNCKLGGLIMYLTHAVRYLNKYSNELIKICDASSSSDGQYSLSLQSCTLTLGQLLESWSEMANYASTAHTVQLLELQIIIPMPYTIPLTSLYLPPI